MSTSKIRENARAALTGKWGKAALMTLAYLAFFFVVGFITGLFGEESLIGSLLELATSIIQVPIVFGLTYSFIKLKRNEEVKSFDFLEIGFSNFGRAWKISLRAALKMILPVIALIVSLLIIVAAAVYTGMSAIADAASVGSSLVILVGFVAYIASIIWLLVVSLLYSLTTFIAYDNPNMSALEVVNESAKMMRGNRGKYFLLDLSFIGWAILAVFTLGIGYLWLLPYIQVAYVCFYEHLLGKKENSDNGVNSENNANDVIVEY